MFNARYKKDKQIYQVLDTYLDPIYGVTMFLIWQKGWKWRPAASFVPPNWKEENNT